MDFRGLYDVILMAGSFASVIAFVVSNMSQLGETIEG